MHIRNIQQKKQSSVSLAAFISESASYAPQNVCPHCGGKLVMRVAKKGSHQGKRFLGCSNYPKCTYKENIHFVKEEN